MNCPNCGYDNIRDMNFCGRCGARLGHECAACGFVNPPEHLFCGKCGVRLAVDTPDPDGRPPTDTELEPQPPLRSLVQTVQEPVALQGERRLATVVLADVVGSTNILEAVGTEEWVHLMSQVLQALEVQVYRFGGIVDQFRGDGLVAFFGASSVHEDDPERAVLAALAMHDAVQGFSTELRKQEGMDLRLRVGVNTGELIVASIGDDRHYTEDTAMGEAITLAARMESAAEPGTVLVAEDTYVLMASRFTWDPMGEVSVKGLREPVKVYRPLGPQVSTARVRHLEPYDRSALMVGRETQFESAKKILERLRNGQGGIVALTGDIGMGKSSFVTALRQEAEREDALLAKAGAWEPTGSPFQDNSLSWLHSRCRSYAQSAPYSIWIDLVGEWLNARPDEPASELHDRLCVQAGELWDDEDYDQYDEHCRNLSALLSLSREEQLVDHLDAEGRRRRVFLTVRNWVKALGNRGPRVLVLEDVHWSDTTSLELLEFCIPMCTQIPVLWLIVFRRDVRSDVEILQQRLQIEYGDELTNLALTPLDEVQGGKLIDRLLGPDVLPEETRTLLLARSEGNPYYIEEFIFRLSRDGVLERDAQSGRWMTTRKVDSLDLPGSLQNLLLARIDRLAPEERRILQMASVIGTVFWTKVLQALTVDPGAAPSPTLSDTELEWHLDGLRRSQLVQEHHRVPALGFEFSFKSDLIRDVVYSGLLSALRETCHRRAADALETILGEKVLPQYYSLLAFHYHQAGATHKELFYRLLAAEEARESYANVEAIEHYTRALAQLEQIEEQSSSESQLYAIRTQRFEVLNGRRQLHFLAGDYSSAWDDAEALLELAEQLHDDPVWLIDALLVQPAARLAAKGGASAKDMAERALSLARDVGDRYREMTALAALAGHQYQINDPSWMETGNDALSIARELEDKRTEARLLIGIGEVFAASDPERSREYLETALEIIADLDDKMLELSLQEIIGVQLENSVDYVRRLNECHAEQLRISREVGHLPAQARALMFVGQIQSIYLGDYVGGLAALSQSHEMSSGQPGELFPLLRIAQSRIMQGELTEAERVLDKAHQLVGLVPHDMGRAGLRLVSAIFFNALGTQSHLLEALDLLSETFEMSAENPELSLQYQMVARCEAAASHLSLAKLEADELLQEEHAAQALEASAAALQIYESFGAVRPIECVSEEILLRHSLALRENGLLSDADAFLLRAHDEMMRKHELIPEDGPFRRTYLDNIPLHREIAELAQRIR